MARVHIYDGHSSIIPIIFEVSNTCGVPNLMKIKEEPLDTVESDDEYSYYNASTNQPEAACGTKKMNCAKNNVSAQHNILTPNGICTSEGSSSMHLNSSENLDSTRIKNVNSIELETRIIGQDQNETNNSYIDTRLRTRTQSHLECDTCYVICPNRVALKIHKKRYSRCESICHLCKLSFSTSINLASHRISAHRGIDWRRYKLECDHCKLKFRKKYTLQQHIFHYHNINKILDSKKINNRTKNCDTKLTKILINTKSCSRKRKRRKSNSSTRIDQVEKKLAMSRDKNDLQYEEQNNQVKNNEKTCDTILVTQQSMTNNQINNNTSLSTLHKPPLVKICAIPNEVEALLNDCDDCDDCDDSEDNFSIYSNNSDDSSYSDMSDIQDNVLPKEYSLRSSAVNRLSFDETPKKSLQEKWTMLRKHFNCRDCQVNLERLNLPLSINCELTNKIVDLSNSDNIESIQINSRPTVGMELKNLDLALKKLQDVHCENNEISCADEKNNLSEYLESSSELTSVENFSLSQITTDTTLSSHNKILYISSLCQTRYTSKKKLIFHYLCFHTNPHYQECAVCRSKCANITELSDHLIEHCIEIPESESDKSPIDPKGPCENCREKYTCKGCKMKFWLVSYLKDHERHCSLVDKITVDNLSNDSQDNIEILVDQPSQSDRSVPLRQNDCIDVECDSISPIECVPETLTSNQQITVQPVQKFKCSICRLPFKTATNLYEHVKRYSKRKVKTYCDRCGTPFPSPPLLGAHTKTAHLAKSSSYEIHCIICEQGFHTKSTLRQHMMHIHNQELMTSFNELAPKKVQNIYKTCRICKTEFSDRRRFIEHSMYYYDDDIIECTICHEKFFGKFRAHGHTKKVHYTEEMQKGYTYCCNICSEGFMYPSHLYAHMYHVHDIAVHYDQNSSIKTTKPDNNQHGLCYMCLICNEMFHTPLLLAEHQLEYSNSGSYTCMKCNRKFETHLLREKHFDLTHCNSHRGNNMKCQICHEVLSSKLSWLCHSKHFHKDSYKNVQSSEICWSDNYSLRKSLESPNISQISVNNSTAQSKNALTCENSVINDNDQDTENDEDSRSSDEIKIEYTCALCDMKFLNRSDLKMHSLKFGNTCVYNNPEIINTDISIASIYSVELADYENLSDAKEGSISEIKMDGQQIISNIKNALRDCDRSENVASETNNETCVKSKNALTCEKCLLTFSSRSSLHKHLNLYSNSGIYECSICHRKFQSFIFYQTHLKKHQNRQHDFTVPQYYCKVCDEKFSSDFTKKSHFAHLHGIIMESRESLILDNTTRRISPRKQSKPMLQTNLDSFISHNLNNENLQMFIKIDGKLMNSSAINQSPLVIDLSNVDVNSYTVANSESQNFDSENIQKDHSTLPEDPLRISNLSPVIINDQLANNSLKKTTEIVELEKEVIDKRQTVIEEENEVVDVEEIVRVENEVIDQTTNIRVDEVSEIIELENVMNKNTASVLCDICGTIFQNRNELCIHQKNDHGSEMNVESFSDTEEFIDIELIDDDNESDVDKSLSNSDDMDIDIIFDSNCGNNESLTASGLIKPKRTYAKKNLLECQICFEKFINLDRLVEHLENHQINKSRETNNIQNPRVSSSSKLISNSNVRSNIRLVHLCCKFCSKQFSNEQYLLAHLKKVHSAELTSKSNENQNKNLVAQQTKSTVTGTDGLQQETSIKTDNPQNNMKNVKQLACAKDSAIIVGKNIDGMKKSGDCVILKKILLKQDLDNVPQYSAHQNSTRISRLVPIHKNTVIIPYNRNPTKKPN